MLLSAAVNQVAFRIEKAKGDFMKQIINMAVVVAMVSPAAAILAYHDYKDRQLESNPQVFAVETPKVKSVMLAKVMPDQTECLAQNIYFEARGEGDAGMKAVANVTINRTKSDKYPSNVCSVIYQPKQFSWVGKYSEIDDEVSYGIAKRIAKTAINGKLRDSTNGADHYHADWIKQPAWAKGMRKTTVIGKHIFYASDRV